MLNNDNLSKFKLDHLITFDNKFLHFIFRKLKKMNLEK